MQERLNITSKVSKKKFQNYIKMLFHKVILVSQQSFEGIVKLHTNLQTQLNFSWLEKELTFFPTEEKEVEKRTHT